MCTNYWIIYGPYYDSEDVCSDSYSRKDRPGVHQLHCRTIYRDSSGEASQNDIMIYI